MIPITSNATLKIPPEIAVCPYCKTQLTVSFDSWTQADDGRWLSDMVSDVHCETEVDPDRRSDWNEWWESHSYMPYVHMLPVQIKITNWVNDNYIFSDRDND